MTLAEVLVGGVRIGRGQEMLADIQAIGVRLAPPDEREPLRLAELRHLTGLKLPDCCVLDTAQTHAAVLCSFDASLTGAARARAVRVIP